MDRGPLSDADLVALARERDAEAFRKLVERHQDYVYNAIYHMVGRRQDVDDLAQEVFLNAYRGLPRFEGRSKFTTWLYGIALNSVRGYWRRRKRVRVFSTDASADDGPTHQLEADGDDPPEAALRRERVEHVRAAIAELEDDMREIVVLRDIQGLTYDELAETLDVPIGTVKSRLYRARRALRDALAPRYGQ